MQSFFCSHAVADGNQRVRIREKTLEFSSTVLSTLSLYLSNSIKIGCVSFHVSVIFHPFVGTSLSFLAFGVILPDIKVLDAEVRWFPWNNQLLCYMYR